MRRLYTYFSRYRFDVDAMREAAAGLVGVHDFKSFCSTYSSAKTTVREVLSIRIEEIPCSTSYNACLFPKPADILTESAGNTGITGNTENTCNSGNTGDVCNTGNTCNSGNTGNSSSTCNSGNTDNMPREIVIRVSGRGFLYNMVRIIAGTLMEVGRGFRKPEDIPSILEACDRRAAGPTAPACGLTLARFQVIEPGYEMDFGRKES
jgi:tRNA U38,U39,U40 pseudouridine synthase TruA